MRLDLPRRLVTLARRVSEPEPLVVASNGHQRRVEPHADGTQTYDWFVSTTIAPYNEALNTLRRLGANLREISIPNTPAEIAAPSAGQRT
jgi:hypothetical protein